MAAKSQRSGPKLKQKIERCSKGHEIFRIKRVPVIGKALMFSTCDCSFTPIDVKAPYQQIKPDGLPGKKRDGVKGGKVKLQS